MEDEDETEEFDTKEFETDGTDDRPGNDGGSRFDSAADRAKLSIEEG